MKGKGNVKTYILQGKKKKRAVSKMMKRRRSSNFLTPNKTLKSSDRSVSRIKLLDPSPRGIKVKKNENNFFLENFGKKENFRST